MAQAGTRRKIGHKGGTAPNTIGATASTASQTVVASTYWCGGCLTGTTPLSSFVCDRRHQGPRASSLLEYFLHFWFSLRRCSGNAHSTVRLFESCGDTSHSLCVISRAFCLGNLRVAEHCDRPSYHCCNLCCTTCRVHLVGILVAFIVGS